MVMQGTSVHIQPLVAVALVGLLRMCADTYVSAELAANGQAAGQHARHLSNVLMRLRASIDPDTLPELSSDLQVCLALPAGSRPCKSELSHCIVAAAQLCCAMAIQDNPAEWGD